MEQIKIREDARTRAFLREDPGLIISDSKLDAGKPKMAMHHSIKGASHRRRERCQCHMRGADENLEALIYTQYDFTRSMSSRSRYRV